MEDARDEHGVRIHAILDDIGRPTKPDDQFAPMLSLPWTAAVRKLAERADGLHYRLARLGRSGSALAREKVYQPDEITARRRR